MIIDIDLLPAPIIYTNENELHSYVFNNETIIGYEYTNRNVRLLIGRPDESHLSVLPYPKVMDMTTKKIVILDCRTEIRIPKEIEYLDEIHKYIRNTANFNQKIITGIVMATYLNNENILTPIIDTIREAYYVWLSNSLINRLVILPQYGDQLRILLAEYILNITSDDSLTGTELAYNISKFTRHDIRDIIDFLKDNNGQNTTIPQLISKINQIETPKLKNFNEALLYQLIGNSWYGLDAKGTATLSLVHIPTFVGVLYSILTEKSHSRSNLKNLLKSASNIKKEMEHFTDYIKKNIIEVH